MNKAVYAIVAAVALVASCSDKAATPPRGVLPPGTAKLAIDGKELGTTYSVRCESIDWMTRIETDLNTSGVSAMVSNANKLTAEFVRFQDIDGFTGSYEHAQQGEAAVTMTGPTYHITGAAQGFNHAEPTRLRTETFSIVLSC